MNHKHANLIVRNLNSDAQACTSRITKTLVNVSYLFFSLICSIYIFTAFYVIKKKKKQVWNKDKGCCSVSQTAASAHPLSQILLHSSKGEE